MADAAPLSSARRRTICWPQRLAVLSCVEADLSDARRLLPTEGGWPPLKLGLSTRRWAAKDRGDSRKARVAHVIDDVAERTELIG